MAHPEEDPYSKGFMASVDHRQRPMTGRIMNTYEKRRSHLAGQRIQSGRNDNNNIYHSNQVFSNGNNSQTRMNMSSSAFRKPNYNESLSRSPPKYIQSY